jgi:dihydrofolate reductase
VTRALVIALALIPSATVSEPAPLTPTEEIEVAAFEALLNSIALLGKETPLSHPDLWCLTIGITPDKDVSEAHDHDPSKASVRTLVSRGHAVKALSECAALPMADLETRGAVGFPRLAAPTGGATFEVKGWIQWKSDMAFQGIQANCRVTMRRGAPGPWTAESPACRSMKISVFVGASVDGFIARPNGGLDWLPNDPEPHGYYEFIATIDTIVIGRNTFEIVLGFGKDSWPYAADKRVVVLSSRPVDLSTAGGVVEQMGGEPAEIAARLAATGARHVYLDGGITVQGFLRAGLVRRLVVTRVPVLIGQGIPLFGALPQDVRLRHVGTRSFPSGLVQTEYEVVA